MSDTRSLHAASSPLIGHGLAASQPGRYLVPGTFCFLQSTSPGPTVAGAIGGASAVATRQSELHHLQHRAQPSWLPIGDLRTTGPSTPCGRRIRVIAASRLGSFQEGSHGQTRSCDRHTTSQRAP